MIAAFLHWWRQQLVELMPKSLRTGTADVLVAELPASGSPSITLWSRAKTGEAWLGRFTADADGRQNLRSVLSNRRPGETLLLRLPAELLMEREVQLPFAASREWRNVLRYEMDRFTPFPVDDLFWDAAIERRDPARGIKVRLSIIRKAAVMPAIDILRAVGLAPAAIEIATAGGTRRLNLIGATSAQPRRVIQFQLLAAVCATLVVIATAIPFLVQWRRGAVVAHEIARLQPAVTQAVSLRQRGTASAANLNIFNVARARVGNPLEVLAAVTKAVPNDSYLTELTLNHLELNLVGQSSSAAALLPALSAYAILVNVAFSAPVTRDPGSHKDLFAIQADVVPQ